MRSHAARPRARIGCDWPGALGWFWPRPPGSSGGTARAADQDWPQWRGPLGTGVVRPPIRPSSGAIPRTSSGKSSIPGGATPRRSSGKTWSSFKRPFPRSRPRPRAERQPGECRPSRAVQSDKPAGSRGARRAACATKMPRLRAAVAVGGAVAVARAAGQDAGDDQPKQEHRFVLMALDRATGKVVWEKQPPGPKCRTKGTMPTTAMRRTRRSLTARACAPISARTVCIASTCRASCCGRRIRPPANLNGLAKAAHRRWPAIRSSLIGITRGTISSRPSTSRPAASCGGSRATRPPVGPRRWWSITKACGRSSPRPPT